MKKVFITGASGFIGMNLVKRMSKEDYYMILITRNAKKLEKELLLQSIKKEKYKILQVDLLSDFSISEANIDVCIHLAWYGLRGKELQNGKVQLVNLDIMIKLMVQMRKNNCNKFISAGSISQCDISGVQARGDKERYYRIVKQLCESYGREYACDIGIEFIWPKITNTFGIGEKSNRFIVTLLQNMTKNLTTNLSSGTQIYDFVYIDDLVDAYLKIVEKGKPNRKYIIGSGQPKSLRDWIEPIPEYCNCKKNLKFGILPFHCAYLSEDDFSIKELQEDTGYQPQIDFLKGIKMTYDWIKGLGDEYNN